MTYRTLKWLTILLAPLIIGGFEFLRHHLLLGYISMDTGNYLITFLTFVLTYIFANWMFHTIKRMNQRLAEEQARRAVYEERERLARELHDNIAQTLFFLNVKLKQGKIEEAQSAVCDIDHHVRQAIFNLRSLPGEDSSFRQRISKWLNEWSLLSGIAMSLNLDIPRNFFSPAEEVQLFGIVQESFANIRKHAGATQANFSLTALPEGWRLWIADNGQGIIGNMDQTKKYGLAMMQERAEQLGASFDIRNRAKGGLEIIILQRKLLKSQPGLVSRPGLQRLETETEKGLVKEVI
ncbi:MAG TPA: histidine kinase [Desulfitobacteriaceae bacterium]|nr:histidine kinase [Desulfitobacteriaceae bacterium]